MQSTKLSRKGILIFIAVVAAICIAIIVSLVNYKAAGGFKPVPYVLHANSDGSVDPVKWWMNENANDPKSIKYISWGPLEKDDDSEWYTVRVRFRGKNALGALVIADKVFTLTERGSVLGAVYYGE
jgi:hypothetical protein